MKTSTVLAGLLGSALPALAALELRIQDKAPWNLRAISHRSPHRAPKVTRLRNFKYYYSWNDETPYYAYVIDSGIRVSHNEFENRAENLWTAFKTSDKKDNFQNGNGHGTHVAGIIASKTYGVAKKARVVSVKVLNNEGRGDLSQAIAGFDAAIRDIHKNRRYHHAVINISAGWTTCSKALATAIDRAYNTRGILTIVAGNEGPGTVQCTPTDSTHSITVGAMAPDWSAAPFTNLRYKVDIFAPGVDILSLAKDSDSATTTKSGTSMAAPHVAALALNAMSVFSKQGQEVTSFLQKTATKNKVKGDLGGSPNLLVNNNNDKQNSCKAQPESDDSC
ncbi:subtilisin-like protease PR1F [Metarhizium acridum CQMa 102]|uniref:Subtilisin-like protease PR1F n=1 Tax=Metarhizium acridum (strain CQMa 102) TaxID=655827 RepID=E9EGD1_METAQ|nr:subtilisin-like protease PR1F [Metarhizium acridum CQMa 102]EFY85046.1 subtilisin-like protease PR1F [Metarhizium acridum CQMa 102]